MALTDSQQRAEDRARALLDAHDIDGAASVLIQMYGSELLGFLAKRIGDTSAAEEVFAEVAEIIWAKLPQLQWRTTARAWCYTIARHQALRHVRAPARRPERNLRISQVPSVAAMVDEVRSRTALHLRTSNKTRLQQLREKLDPEDQLIISLRVNRGLEWREMAEIFVEGGDAPGGTDARALERESARLRQRFKAAKDQLARYASNEGLLGRETR